MEIDIIFLALSANLFSFLLLGRRVIIPTSIDSWLKLIILTIPIYFVSMKAVRIHRETIDEMKETHSESTDGLEEGAQGAFSKIYKNMLLSAGFCGLALTFWRITDWVDIKLFSFSFLWGYLIMISLSLIFIIKFNEHTS